jgi:endonuclease G
MDDKQRKLIDYFNSLSDPVPPPTLPGAVDFGIEEAAVPASSLVAPLAATSEGILERLQRRVAPGGVEFALDANGAGDDSVLKAAGLADALPAETPITARPLPFGIVDIAAGAIAKAQSGQEMTPADVLVLEQVILPGQRPVIDVVNGAMATPPAGWEWLDAYRESLGKVISSIGRIDVPGLPTLPYAGTGFVVGDDLLLTNRHVAQVFVNGLGAGQKYLMFRSTLGACLDPKYEVGDPEPGSGAVRFQVVDALLVHPHWDAALLRVAPADGAALPPPLALARRPPAFFGGGGSLNVAVIGYPMLDFRGNVPEQMSIFRNIFGRKRIAPGFLKGFASLPNKSGGTVQAVEHDASTLGGNSGSAIVDLTSGLVVGLHFGGEYLKANYGVPSWELERDERVTTLGVKFADLPDAAVDPAGLGLPDWLKAWDRVRPLEPAVV